MKKILSVILTGIIVFAFTFSTLATDGIEPYAHEICNGYTYHLMVSEGNCYIVNQNNTVIHRFWGLFRCKRCGTEIVCSNHPDSTGTNGAWNYIEHMYGNVVVEGSVENNHRVKVYDSMITVNGVLPYYNFELPEGGPYRFEKH